MWFNSILIVTIISASIVNVAEAENPKFKLYTGLDDYKEVDVENCALLTQDYSPYFCKEKSCSIIIVLGYNNDPNITFYRDFISSHIEGHLAKCNIVLYDWSDAANAYLLEEKQKYNVTSGLYADYPLVVIFMDVVAKMLCKALINCFSQSGYDLGKVYFVGHSLGVHISGRACNCAHQGGTSQCARIVGLDPAGPGVCTNRFSAADAKCTISINTDSCLYGSNEFSAHGNFHADDKYYNCKIAQPGCLEERIPCSHRRPIYLMNEMNKNATCIAASPAVSRPEWYKGIQGQKVYLNLFMEPCPNGSYYFCTAGEPEYGLGDAGIVPENCYSANCLLGCRDIARQCSVPKLSLL